MLNNKGEKQTKKGQLKKVQILQLNNEDHFSPVSTGLECVRMQQTDLEEHVVGCHSELAGVEHQAFSEQGEEAVTQHDLRFPPDQDIKRSKVSQ